MRKVNHKYNPKENDGIVDSRYTKKLKLWEEAEALFWSLAFKEETERYLPTGCAWKRKAPTCQ